MFGVFKIKNGGFLIKSYEGDVVNEKGQITNVDYAVAILNPKNCPRVEHAVYAFSIFQANTDLVMPAANVVRCVGINNKDKDDYEMFDTLDQVKDFIEKNSIAPYAWKNCLVSSKYKFDDFVKFFDKPLIGLEDDEVASLIFGDPNGQN